MIANMPENWSSTDAERLREAEAHIAKLRRVLLHYWGTTDPELLAEVWADRLPNVQSAAEPDAGSPL